MYHVDIAKNKIAHLKNSVVASIEKLPFNDMVFDYIICVGSVINYCDAMAAIAEMSRVLKKHGMLILEFENSFSFEYYGKTEYGKSAEIVTTKYMDRSHQLWVYSFDYIKRILTEFSFGIRNFSAFHILSSLRLKKIDNENIAAGLAKFDCILRHMPYFRKHAGNIILLCEKL
jgi:ubiquinone/menaquinone biosynthesis C-methylase UbiE